VKEPAMLFLIAGVQPGALPLAVHLL